MAEFSYTEFEFKQLTQFQLISRVIIKSDDVAGDRIVFVVFGALLFEAWFSHFICIWQMDGAGHELL